MVRQYIYRSSILMYHQYIPDNVYGICAVKAEVPDEKADHEDRAGAEYVPGIHEHDRRVLYLKGDEPDAEPCGAGACIFGGIGADILCVQRLLRHDAEGAGRVGTDRRRDEIPDIYEDHVPVE